MPAKTRRKPSPAQLRARADFARRARSGEWKGNRKTRSARKGRKTRTPRARASLPAVAFIPASRLETPSMARSRKKGARRKAVRVTVRRRTTAPRRRSGGGLGMLSRFIPGGALPVAAGVAGGVVLNQFVLNRVPGNLQDTPMKRFAASAAVAVGAYALGRRFMGPGNARNVAAGILAGAALSAFASQINNLTKRPGVNGLDDDDGIDGWGGEYQGIQGWDVAPGYPSLPMIADEQAAAILAAQGATA